MRRHNNCLQSGTGHSQMGTWTSSSLSFLSCFPQLLVPKSSNPLPFAAIGTSSDYPKMNLVQPQNALSLYLIRVPNAWAATSISVKSVLENLSPWLLLMGFTLGYLGWGYYVRFPVCHSASLCLWRWTFGGLMTPVTGPGRARQSMFGAPHLP